MYGFSHTKKNCSYLFRGWHVHMLYFLLSADVGYFPSVFLVFFLFFLVFHNLFIIFPFPLIWCSLHGSLELFSFFSMFPFSPFVFHFYLFIWNHKLFPPVGWVLIYQYLTRKNIFYSFYYHFIDSIFILFILFSFNLPKLLDILQMVYFPFCWLNTDNIGSKGCSIQLRISPETGSIGVWSKQTILVWVEEGWGSESWGEWVT